MIVFDLQCSNGHNFEGWFHNTDSFEEQNRRKLLSCPVCGDPLVKRILSPVATRARRTEPERNGEAPPIDYRKLAVEVLQYINRNFEDVGSEFTKEALKMHYGVVEKKNILGSATEDEEKTLREERIDFFKIPSLKKQEDDKN